MAGHMSNRNIVRIEPVDTALRRLPHRKIRYRRADVKVRYREILDNTPSTSGRINRSTVLGIAATRTVCGVLNQAVVPPSTTM